VETQRFHPVGRVRRRGPDRERLPAYPGLRNCAVQVLKAEIRESILQAAERQFYRSGFEGVPMRRIADEVGISVSAVYKYFTNKKALFAAVADPFVRELERSASELFAEEHHALDARVADLATAQIVRLIRADRRRFVIVMGAARGRATRRSRASSWS